MEKPKYNDEQRAVHEQEKVKYVQAMVQHSGMTYQDAIAAWNASVKFIEDIQGLMQEATANMDDGTKGATLGAMVSNMRRLADEMESMALLRVLFGSTFK